MSSGEMKIKDLVAKGECAVVEFKRARGDVSIGFYCHFRECGDKGGKWIVKKAES